MFPIKYPVPQSDPPKSPRETLPTMYDLPSENPEESGLPDEFHDWQAQLLSLTFCPPHYPVEEVFCASDMNLYYDVRHALWYKRPDWFGVVGNWILTEAEQERQRAEEAESRAEEAESRLESLLQRLWESGIDPDR